MVKQVCKKLKKNLTAEEIAELFEEDINEVQQICDVASRYAPDYDADKITEELLKDS